ncbi:MAG: transporter substrate-binding domain-containing protein [Betaproteobacteria bacterium]|nr:transporter substrate-binding domain-containing protein [Betaproteobacteria bacterium]
MIEVTAALRAEFAPTGTLRVGLNMSNFLLTRTDAASGKPLGVAHDLGQELARRLGLPVQFVPHPNPGALADVANKNVWDVGFLGAEPQRANEIDFTAAYVEIESTYLVPPGSPLKHAGEVDRKGVRIIVPEKAAYELFLSRTIKNAELVKDKGADLCFKRFVEEKFDALAGLKPRLMSDQAKLPGSVIVAGNFTAVQQAAGVPKGRPNAAKYLAAFIEDVKASGVVAKAIQDNNVVGLSIAAKA